MAITLELINDLRKRTGVGIMDCKKALQETDGDIDKAIEELKKKGLAKAAKKQDRETTEGGVFIQTNNNKGVILSILCETDFVARTDDFKKLGNDITTLYLTEGKEAATPKADAIIKDSVLKLGENLVIKEVAEIAGNNLNSYIHSNGKVAALASFTGDIAEEMGKDINMQIVAMNPSCLNPSDVSDEEIAKEKEIWIEQLKNEGKPENIIENILKGKEKKQREEKALLTQVFVKDNSLTIDKLISGKGEIKEFIRFEI